MAGLLVATPAFGLDDIRDRIRDVERQQAETDADQRAAEERSAELAHDLDETSAELQAAEKRLRETTAKVEQARIDLSIAEDELAAAEAEEHRIQGELEVAYANEAKIEDSLADNAAAQEETRAAAGAIARESYKSGGLGNVAMTLEMLSGSGDAIMEMSMARTVLRVQDSTLGRLGVQQAEESAEQDRLAGVRRDIAFLLAEAEANTIRSQDARDVAEAAKIELETLEAQQAADKDALEAEVAKLEEHLAAEEAEAAELEQELAELAQEKYGLKQDEKAEEERLAEQARLKREAEERARREAAQEQARKDAAAEKARQEAADERARQERARREAADERASRSRPAPAPAAPQPAPAPPKAAPAPPPPAPAPPPPAPAPPPAPEPQPPSPAPEPPPPPAAGVLSHPVDAPTTSEFGWRVHPVLGYARLHAGLDYGAACGTPVRAAAGGTIISAAFTSGGGNKVIIDHGVLNGVNLTTSYLHLQSFERTGGSVARGDVIGYVGTTGLSTGCHLHFETRENGNPVNPRDWL